MSCCSSPHRSVIWSGTRRGTTPPARCRGPCWPGGPCRRLDGGRRGRNTRSWGADAPLGRAGCLLDRAPRLGGRRCPSPRSPATTRSSCLAHGTRCTSGRDPKDPWRQGTPMREPLSPTLPRPAAIPEPGAVGATPCPVGAAPGPPECPRVLPMPAFRDDFDGDDLDPAVWDPHYLPAWSSRAATAARHRVSASRLRLWIPAGQPLWCPDQHPTPLRVSGIASGGHSGPVGSTVGGTALPRRAARAGEAATTRGLAAPTRIARGRVPDGALGPLHGGGLAQRLRGVARRTPGSSAWSRSSARTGCRGAPPRSGWASRGCTTRASSRTSRRPRLPIDVGQWHEYAVRWDEQLAEFSVDGEHVRTCARPPTYPMQVMIAVFDFPDWPGDASVPALEVEWIGGEST